MEKYKFIFEPTHNIDDKSGQRQQKMEYAEAILVLTHTTWNRGIEEAKKRTEKLKKIRIAYE
jgi:hypothetical protein